MGTESEMSTMRKIPVIILTKLMLGLPAGQEEEVQSLVGAFSICMEPGDRTCMNVVVGRRQNADGGFSLDKFALYYPNNTDCAARWGGDWDMLHGYSFRTAALAGSLNWGGLAAIGHGSIQATDGTDFNAADYGLTKDRRSCE